MTTTVKQAIDAVRTDLELLALPAHGTFLYAKGRFLRIDQKSWLNIFPQKVEPTLISTISNYDDSVLVIIEWLMPTFAGIETNIDDQTVASAGLDTAQLICDQLRTYGNGVPGLFNTTAKLLSADWDLDSGGKWCMSATIGVEIFE